MKKLLIIGVIAISAGASAFIVLQMRNLSRFQALVSSAQKESGEGRSEDAWRLISDALTIGESSKGLASRLDPVRLLAAEIGLGAKQYEAVRSLCDELRNSPSLSDEQRKKAAFFLGLSLYNLARHEEASSVLKSYLSSVNPNSDEGLKAAVLLGNTLAALNRGEEAVEAVAGLVKAREADPGADPAAAVRAKTRLAIMAAQAKPAEALVLAEAAVAAAEALQSDERTKAVFLHDALRAKAFALMENGKKSLLLDTYARLCELKRKLGPPYDKNLAELEAFLKKEGYRPPS